MKTLLLLLALAFVPGAAVPLRAAQIHVDVPGVAVPNPGPNDIAIDNNNRHSTVTCKDGGGLYVRGNGNHLQVDGRCTTVHVMGNKNVVAVAERTVLVTEGNGNVVHYSDPKTRVSTLGNGNSVSLVGK